MQTEKKTCIMEETKKEASDTEIRHEEPIPGIRCHYIRTDRFKTATLTVNFILPLSSDRAGYYAWLTQILRSGCVTYPNQRAICRRLEELYGSDITTQNQRRGDRQIISFSADILEDAYRMPGDKTDIHQAVFDLLTDLLCRPLIDENGRFPDRYTETERKNRIDALRAIINSKGRLAFTRLRETMFEGDVYAASIEGKLSDYTEPDYDRLLTCYRALFHEARVEIFYVGRRSRRKVAPLLVRLLSAFPADANRRMPDTKTAVCRPAVRYAEESADATQGRLAMGFCADVPAAPADIAVFSVFCELYGSGNTSKLFMNVREKLSLCYSCQLSTDRYKGAVFVTAGIANENRDATEREILDQLEQIRQNSITPDEMQAAVASLLTMYRSIEDSPASVALWYFLRALEGSADTPEERAANVRAVTPEQVTACARRVRCDTVFYLRAAGESDGEEEEEEGDEDDA